MEAQENVIRRRPLREAGISYSLAALLTVILSLILSVILRLAGASETAQDEDWFKYIGFLLSQVCFAVAAIVFFRRTKQPVKEIYRPCQWHYFAVALLLQFGLLFSLNFLNETFIGWLETFGYRPAMADSVPSLDGWNILPALLIIAILPAFFEETLFRGVLVGSMQQGGWGTASTVLISGALFALFHGSPEQTIYQFLCGASFALLAQRAGSILPGMIAHFANNAIILILTACNVDLNALPLYGTVVLYTLSAVCLAGGVLFLLLQKKNVRGGVKDGKEFFLAAAVGIGICVMEWLVALVGGFTVV